MAKSVIDRIEYLVLLVAEFARLNKVSEVQSYRYLQQYGALALCEKHYNIMHTLSVEENLQTLREYCQRKEAIYDSISWHNGRYRSYRSYEIQAQ